MTMDILKEMPLYTLRNISLRCLQNVTFLLKKPHRSFMIILKMPILMEAHSRCFCACLFKCKWTGMTLKRTISAK